MERFNSDMEDFERDMGIDPGFFKVLAKEPDWAFVVKLQALMESAINSLLREHFHEPKMEAFLGVLTYNGGAASKLSLVRDLELLPNELLKFFTGLASIRNKWVHGVRDVDNTLQAHYEALPLPQQKQFLDNISCLVDTRLPLKNTIRDLIEAGGFHAIVLLFTWRKVHKLTKGATRDEWLHFIEDFVTKTKTPD
ncbi:hypothetical protein OJ996_11525 [Luteolibacter sp. GHJ8]|uniref:DUF4145 domain-containing protein n=1 Tax=Luteolibacter rhizosphaerae TaxID=2989719 RepID=A0ABT3G2Y9_9BACT|nr:hypothetical protein [Luteolibacter rhizosphaerae]MCW1914209.1 hypothetical protein [Luteolibacter rhizosphaerae]